MRRTTCILAAGALISALFLGFRPPRLHADLEVTIPPGTPAEWYRELPDRFPRYRQVQTEKGKPKKEPKKDDEKGTTVREKDEITTEARARPELGSGTYQPKLFSGVLTDDLPFHVPWVKRKGELVGRSYPPTITDDMYWMAQAAYLRRLLHPSLAPEHEIYWYLVMIGDAAREVTPGAKAERFLEPLAGAIEGVIAKLPDAPPEPPAAPQGATAEQKMILRVARDDLISGDPYGLDPTYAARVLSLGDAALPALLACMKHEHALLRRNAVALLGHYAQPEALEAVRKAFREDKDPTTRTRALFHLVRRKDAEIVADLVRGLTSPDDKRFPPLAAFGLGEIGGAEAAAALKQAVEGAGQDWDLLVTAVPALARASAGNADAVKAAVPVLKKVEESLRGPQARFKEDVGQTNPPKADIPDRPELRNRMLLELATCALARLGDREGQARLVQLIAGKYEDAKSPTGHSNASGPERQSQCEALKWVCPTTHELLIEAWGAMGPEGAARLRQIIDHVRTSERLRVAALKIDTMARDKAYLGQVALGSDSASVRALAVRLLTNIDDKAGARVAEAIFQKFASGQPMSKTNPKGDVSVVSALEVLHRARKLKPATLKQALPRAIQEYELTKPDVSAEGMKPFYFSPPILETVCWMLGATQDKEAVSVLRKIAADAKSPARAEAVLALGKVPGAAATAALAELLDDEDGWIRYNAYLALRGSTGQDHFADWIYGSRSDREGAVAEWREYVKGKKK